MTSASRTRTRGKGRRKRALEPVGGVVAEVLERIGIRERVERSATVARWNEVVGPHIARVTRPGGIKGGTLFVEVAGAGWMSELNMMRRTLIRRLNEDRERGRIERIVFVQSENRAGGVDGEVGDREGALGR